MSLLGPPTQELPQRSVTSPVDTQGPERQLEQILSWLPGLMSIHDEEPKLQPGAELLDALEAVAVWLLEQNRPRDAVRMFETALHLYPHENRLKKCMAVVLTAAGDHANALLSWQKVCELSPHDAENQIMLAQALYVSGDIPAAKESFRHWFATWLGLEDLPAGLKTSAMQWDRWLQSLG
jgi:predicted Zn-dependent protease